MSSYTQPIMDNRSIIYFATDPMPCRYGSVFLSDEEEEQDDKGMYGEPVDAYTSRWAGLFSSKAVGEVVWEHSLIALLALFILENLVLLLSTFWPPIFGHSRLTTGASTLFPFFSHPYYIGLLASITVRVASFALGDITAMLSLSPRVSKIIQTYFTALSTELLRLISLYAVLFATGSSTRESLHLPLANDLFYASGHLALGWAWSEIFCEIGRAWIAGEKLGRRVEEVEEDVERGEKVGLLVDYEEKVLVPVVVVDGGVTREQRMAADEALNQSLDLSFPTNSFPIRLLSLLTPLLHNLSATLLLSAFFFHKDHILPTYHASLGLSSFFSMQMESPAAFPLVAGLLVGGRVVAAVVNQQRRQGSSEWQYLGAVVGLSLGSLALGLGAWGGLV